MKKKKRIKKLYTELQRSKQRLLTWKLINENHELLWLHELIVAAYTKQLRDLNS